MVLPALFYPLAAVRRGVFYVGDIFRLYYPTRAVYASAIRHGDLPLWSSDILAGFPLFAEGQIGALYPLNLVLYSALPIDVALNYSILLSVGLGGVAMYGLARVLRLRPAAALVAALVFACSGFFVGHFNHLNILAAGPWLPVQLALSEILIGRRWSDGVRRTDPPVEPLMASGLALAVGIQFLAGHPQMWLISMLTVLVFALARTVWPATGQRPSWAEAVRGLLPVGVALAAGTLLAAVQLLPTWELVRQSVRAGGLAGESLASFSWHPALLATLVVPFALGSPYPNVSVEFAAYLGMLPLLLAASGVVRHRRSQLTRLLAVIAAGSLIFAFGDYTPVFPLLGRLPIINFFRVPARFLYPFTLACALLAGLGLETWLKREQESLEQTEPASEGRSGGRTRGITPWLVGGVVLVTVAGTRLASLDTLLTVRWAAPAALLVTAAGLLALRSRLTPTAFIVAAIGLILIDLYAFAAVFRLTYNDLMPVEDFYTTPATVEFLPADPSSYRSLTHEAIVPALSVMRASLYPDISLLYQRPSANGYFPLIPGRHAEYLDGLSAGRLNLLNVRYFLIPQLLAVGADAEDYDLHNPFMADPVGTRLEIPPTLAAQIELVSFTSQSANWEQGEVVATIVLAGQEGSTARLPLRAGEHTAEWAFDREDVADTIAHQQPPVAETWPARSGFPPVEHPGHAYRAVVSLPAPMVIEALEIRTAKPEGLIHVLELVLVGQDGRHNLATLLGRGHHKLVYRDPDVTIYENLDALPRAYVVARAHGVADTGDALAMIDNPDWDPRREVLLEAGARSESGNSAIDGSLPTSGDAAPRRPASESARVTEYTSRRVVVEADLANAGYLVLLDSYYPGWRATVDGIPAEILRANVLFRAVQLDAGRHTVIFEYAPMILRLGAIISALTFVGAIAFGAASVGRHR